MRYAIPALFLASPALAHPASLPHGHSGDWAVPVALMLIGAAVVLAKRKAVRVRRRQ
ncbi:hypothetical protein [Ruegeria faecimaris]|uniref:hypothetical protein n=1 Tax=Ruegeria faecimaris TaxID=686389 RepID=UPI0024914125|nr:hypothetical protein [Ruegeria faecimaris]